MALKERIDRMAEYAGENRLLVLAVFVAVAVRLLYWVVTDRTWEDTLITTIHAVNAVEGLGLTHHAGEGRVHGFTSAISVLIPLAGELIHRGSGIFALKLSALFASAVTIAYAYGVSKEIKLDSWSAAFFLFYLALNKNQIHYGMSGMETQIAVMVLMGGIYHLIKGEHIKCGVWLGAALLARPDHVLWVGPAVLYMLWRDRKGGLKAASTAFAVVLPWLVFTTLYYGSPVPHTIKAKSTSFNRLAELTLNAGAISSYLKETFSIHIVQLLIYFTPFLDDMFCTVVGMEPYLYAIGVVFCSLTALGIIKTKANPLLFPAACYAIFFISYTALTMSWGVPGWYIPPFMAVSAMFAAVSLSGLAVTRRILSRALGIVLVLVFAVHLPFAFPFEATIQKRIENKVRLPLAKYLNDMAGPGEAVVSESAGYVGYYGRVLLYDFPGLTSPTSLAVIKNLPRSERNLYSLIGMLQPEWLVMRDREVDEFNTLLPEISRRYWKVAHFGVEEDLMGWFSLSKWRVVMINVDKEFYILRRRN